MRNKKTFWSIVIILVIIGGGGYYYYDGFYLPTQATVEAAPVQTTKVRTGDIMVSASGAGTAMSQREVSVGFKNSGTLVELGVQVGDSVTAGQVIARLDNTDASAQLAQAETNLALAELKLSQSDIAIQQAEANLTLAELKLTAVQNPGDETSIAIAQANLDSAQSDLDALLAGPSSEDISIAQADLEQAAIAVQQAQAAYDKIAWADRVGETAQAAALQNATLNYEKALATYQLRTEGATASQISAAESKVLQAQQTLDILLNGADEDDIVSAQVAVSQAQNSLLLAQDTTALEIAVQQAQLAVDSANRALDETELRAPFDGSISAVNATTGELVNTAPIITLVDTNHMQLEIYLDETDMDKIAIDNDVEVEFDAIPDIIFPGTVTHINPVLLLVDGVPAINAIAELSAPADVEDVPQLMSGMNAAVEVIAGRADDVVLVPVESLRELGPGQYAVFVMVDGEPQFRPIEVGLVDFTYAEIVSGLSAGELVTTGTIDTE